MDILQLVSISLEAIIVIIALMIAVSKKRVYGYGFALTFGIYVFYDLARLFSFEVNEMLLYTIFFVATVSALVSMLKLYREF
ncbi:MAG: hypothetical protein KKB24_05720 [Candidatus Altiarchaeota archaeon]|nr:hypothetical protein [Candidatus Altiarchaeota archaeon]